jgi:hypothetical protein
MPLRLKSCVRLDVVNSAAAMSAGVWPWSIEVWI